MKGKIIAILVMMLLIAASFLPVTGTKKLNKIDVETTSYQCIPPPPNMIGWWTGDSVTQDLIGNNDGTWIGTESYVPGIVDYAFDFDMFTNSYVEIPDHSSLDLGLDSFTIDFWMELHVGGVLGKYDLQTQIGFAVASDLIVGQSSFVLFFQLNSELYVAGHEGNVGDPTHVAIVVDRSIQNGGSIYINGVETQIFDAGSAGNVNNNEPLKIGSGFPYYDTFGGFIDEVEIFDRALTEFEVESIYNAGGAGKCKYYSCPPGMISYWKLDETSGSVNDFFDGNDGNNYGATRGLQGKVNKAFSFDGIDDYVDIPHHNSLNLGTGEFTFEAWINGTGTENYPIILSKRTWATGQESDGFIFGLSKLTGVGYELFVQLDGKNYLSGSQSLNDGGWHHVVATRNDVNLVTFYVDGIPLPNTYTSHKDIDSDTAGSLYIGRDKPTDPNNYWEGLIDEVAIYDESLSAQTIKRHYLCGLEELGYCDCSCCCPLGLKSYWKLDETLGSVYDSFDGNDGTNYGAIRGAQGQVNKAFSFDGIDDYVDIPHRNNLNLGTDDFTLEALIKYDGPTDGSVPYPAIMSKRPGPPGSNPDGGFLLSLSYWSGGTLGSLLLRINDMNYVPCSTRVDDGKWYHVAVTRSGTDITFYVNGIIDGTAVSGKDADSNANLRLGLDDSSSVDTEWEGNLDEVAIYNESLSAQTIMCHYLVGLEGLGYCSGPLIVYTNRVSYNPGEPVAITVENLCNNPVNFDVQPMIEIYDPSGNLIYPPSIVQIPGVLGSNTYLWFPASSVPSGKYTIKTVTDLHASCEAMTNFYIRNKGYVILVSGHWGSLKPQINMACNQIYDDLIYVGYTPDRICYLNKDTFPGVDDIASSAKVQWAIETWAATKVGLCEPLFLIMFDHGGDDIFCVDNPVVPGDTVSASDLATWLNNLESATTASTYVWYMGCHSGSFIDDLSSYGRVTITSCRANEYSYVAAAPYFEYFSSVYWPKIKMGQSLRQAFNYGSQYAAGQMGYHPLLDDNADGAGHGYDTPTGSGFLPHDGDGDLAQWIFMKNTGRIFPWISYTIAKEFYEWPPQDITTLWATVENEAPLTHVRAWMLPPDWTPPPPGDELEMVEVPLECFEMWDPDEDGTWEVDIPAENFTNHANGTSDFKFMITAEEENGNTAHPVWTAVGFTETGQPPPDNTSPFGWIDFPLSGQIVNGTISINGTATDDVCLQKAEFYVDGDLIGQVDLPVTSNSYFELIFDTTTLSDGRKTIQVKVFDTSNNVGNHTVDIIVVKPPTAPIIDGPKSGKIGVEYCWTFHSDDTDGNLIKYIIDWGDGTTTETDCVEPCTPITECHTYDSKATFTIRAKAQECPDGLESEWSEFEVTMPRNKAISNNLLLLRLLESFPLLERLLSCFNLFD